MHSNTMIRTAGIEQWTFCVFVRCFITVNYTVIVFIFLPYALFTTMKLSIITFI